MEKLIYVIVFLLVIFSFFSVKGYFKARELGYRKYSDNLSRRWVQSFQKSCSLRLIGTTQAEGLYVFETISDSGETSEPFILMDVIVHVPREQLLCIGAKYQLFVSSVDGAILMQKYNEYTTQEKFEKFNQLKNGHQ